LGFQNGDRSPCSILKFSQILLKIQICAYFTAEFGEDRTSAAEVLRIFEFQNGGRLPSWIWYDVITDNP